MKRISLLWLAAVVAAVLAAGPAVAQQACETACDPCNDPCTGGLLDGSLNGGGGIVFESEVLFFRYHRADGVRAGSFNNFPPAVTDDVQFDHAASPRFTLGYVADNGLGFRVRAWDYDQTGGAVFPGTGVSMAVDTFTIDLEIFEDIQLNDCWSLELSGGVRYNDFTETMIDPIPAGQFRQNAFSGYGGILGVEATRSLGGWGGLYARGRAGILMDDKFVRNVRGPGTPNQVAVLTDSVLGQTEIALGYEATRYVGNSLFTLRAGYEWQQWHNYSTAFTPVTSTPPANPPASFAGLSDVGFAGFTAMLGFEY